MEGMWCSVVWCGIVVGCIAVVVVDVKVPVMVLRKHWLASNIKGLVGLVVEAEYVVVVRVVMVVVPVVCGEFSGGYILLRLLP